MYLPISLSAWFALTLFVYALVGMCQHQTNDLMIRSVASEVIGLF